MNKHCTPSFTLQRYKARCAALRLLGKYAGESGFTLIELIIAMSIGLIILVSIYSLFTSQQRAYSVQEQMAEMQQNVRIAMDATVKKLQTAGYDPQRAKVFGVTVYQTASPYFPNSDTPGFSLAAAAELYFTTDNDGDGVIDNNGYERFAFRINNDTLQIASILDTNGDISSWRTLARNIEGMAVTYTYSDGSISSGTADLPNNNVSGKNFKDIRVVTVSLTARTGKKNPQLNDYKRMTLSSAVMLRNLGY
ncbi:MAG: prepilin-type N-terminal cleavage/methylation domain-containing protein [Nitrospinae bacterium]|nr:prepilin-type N-terminal cleavage/methylation domain-containing protein [Nitrospinota bacterium]